ncbi:transcriptional regulator [Enterococcus alcedinis]|uniref:Transcriptional regulator n=2 Tax=Enterococcus alcedinis TaxID=1274384 RepID=A0A917JCY2_9ENTE|nr:helix-turn-helix transcriptional regulator [Enterococcus alcedinis]MBP2101143.1 transcriptional regulator with XRE-family HTH domain [Enterococcus alcedinis]GGI64558.1 transcriptional regulator [Enterococcus alcedinis]
MSNKQESLGETLKNLRKAHRMTQKMLAEGICAQSLISRVENNEELPNVVILQQICQRLDVTLDQLMQFESEEIHGRNDRFNKIHHHFIQKNYLKLAQLLKDESLLSTLYLEADFQRYDYYLSICAFHVDKKPIKALELLKKAISSTHNRESLNLSTIEIQMMSDLGRMYHQKGQLELALVELRKVYQLVDGLPEERRTFELNKVYYYYGDVLFELEHYEESFEIVQEGMALAQQFCSYYYLEELFMLNGQLLQETQQIAEATEYFFLAKMVQRIVQD